jgi:hypothetical protein
MKVKPMDKLAIQLREDAASINVAVSAELDVRIRASLEAVTQEGPQEGPQENAAPTRPRSMWWASSLTGILAASIVILLINLNQPAPPPAVIDAPVSALFQPQLIIDPAVMTAPLQKELEDLEADLKKAEAAVRKEFGLFP